MSGVGDFPPTPPPTQAVVLATPIIEIPTWVWVTIVSFFGFYCCMYLLCCLMPFFVVSVKDVESRRKKNREPKKSKSVMTSVEKTNTTETNADAGVPPARNEAGVDANTHRFDYGASTFIVTEWTSSSSSSSSSTTHV